MTADTFGCGFQEDHPSAFEGVCIQAVHKPGCAVSDEPGHPPRSVFDRRSIAFPACSEKTSQAAQAYGVGQGFAQGAAMPAVAFTRRLPCSFGACLWKCKHPNMRKQSRRTGWIFSSAYGKIQTHWGETVQEQRCATGGRRPSHKSERSDLPCMQASVRRVRRRCSDGRSLHEQRNIPLLACSKPVKKDCAAGGIACARSEISEERSWRI